MTRLAVALLFSALLAAPLAAGAQPAGKRYRIAFLSSAWEQQPWIAVQRATWESLRRREAEAA